MNDGIADIPCNGKTKTILITMGDTGKFVGRIAHFGEVRRGMGMGMVGKPINIEQGD